MASEYPEDWSEGSVESLMEAIIDYRGKTPTKTASGIPLVTAKIIKDGRIRPPTEFIAESDYDAWMRRGLPRAGDVLITTEAPLGEVAQLRSSAVALAQRVILLRGQSGVLNNTFLRFVLQSHPVQAQLRSRSSGTTVTGIKQRELRKVVLPLPSLPEQCRIAAVLGALDDKIELNRKMNRTLEEMAQAIFKSWFIGFDGVSDSKMVDSELGPIPKGWEVKSLDSIAHFLNGAACQKYPCENGGPSLPVIKIRELNQGITTKTDRATTDIPKKWWVADGDVLFSWSGSLVVTVWTGGPGALNQHLFNVTSEAFPRWFYLLWTKYHLARFQRIAADKATTMGHIKRRHLTEAQCVVPPLHVMQRQSEVLAPLIERQVANSLQGRTLAQLRDSLLPKLISGEVRVPEAEEDAA